MAYLSLSRSSSFHSNTTRLTMMSSATGTTSSHAATANAAGALESDVVLVHSPPSSSISSKWTRAALLVLIAILAIIAVSITVGVNTDRKVMPDPPVPVAQSAVQEAEPVKEDNNSSSTIPTESPKADEAPKPAPTLDPSKKENNNLKTMMPTVGATVTVSTETSSPPTGSDRSDRRSLIRSPTWRG